MTASPAPSSREDLLRRLDRVRVATISDCLDAAGHASRVVDARIRPLVSHFRLAGFAVTVHLVEVDGPPDDPADYYRNELAAVDALRPGDVLVASECSGAAFWGELLASGARHRGARGVVADAPARDSAMLVEMGFPTFVTGMDPRDSLGRIDVDSVDEPVECGGVTVRPGDLIVGDVDGVAVVPAGVVDDIVRAAEEKTASEDVMRGDLQSGMPVTDAFRTHGIL
jgi:4-hydroxy-4-methyl-2-oxoglutarate aldolase